MSIGSCDLKKLRNIGFDKVFTMTWMAGGVGSFKIEPKDDLVLSKKSVVYVWYDKLNSKVMYVGRTGQTLKARFLYAAGYEKWLNGQREGDVETPVRYRWLNYLSQECQSGEVEVYALPCLPETLHSDEFRFMQEFNPVLNVHR